jgi:hypothetical protein
MVLVFVLVHRHALRWECKTRHPLQQFVFVETSVGVAGARRKWRHGPTALVVLVDDDVVDDAPTCTTGV